MKTTIHNRISVNDFNYRVNIVASYPEIDGPAISDIKKKLTEDLKGNCDLEEDDIRELDSAIGLLRKSAEGSSTFDRMIFGMDDIRYYLISKSVDIPGKKLTESQWHRKVIRITLTTTDGRYRYHDPLFYTMAKAEKATEALRKSGYYSKVEIIVPKVKVEVDWDFDDGNGDDSNPGIPGIVEVPACLTEEEVTDWLSDTYGYCVNGWTCS